MTEYNAIAVTDSENPGDLGWPACRTLLEKSNNRSPTCGGHPHLRAQTSSEGFSQRPSFSGKPSAAFTSAVPLGS